FFEYIFTYLSTDNIIGNFLLDSLYSNTQNGQYLYFAVSEITDIQEIINKMIHEIMNPSLLSDSTIKLYMGLFFVELIKHSDKLKQNEKNPVQHYIIVEAMKYIDEHYQTASLYELAQKMNQPQYEISREIKKATYYTFTE